MHIMSCHFHVLKIEHHFVERLNRTCIEKQNQSITKKTPHNDRTRNTFEISFTVSFVLCYLIPYNIRYKGRLKIIKNLFNTSVCSCLSQTRNISPLLFLFVYKNMVHLYVADSTYASIFFNLYTLKLKDSCKPHPDAQYSQMMINIATLLKRMVIRNIINGKTKKSLK